MWEAGLHPDREIILANLHASAASLKDVLSTFHQFVRLLSRQEHTLLMEMNQNWASRILCDSKYLSAILVGMLTLSAKGKTWLPCVRRGSSGIADLLVERAPRSLRFHLLHNQHKMCCVAMQFKCALLWKERPCLSVNCIEV